LPTRRSSDLAPAGAHFAQHAFLEHARLVRIVRATQLLDRDHPADGAILAPPDGPHATPTELTEQRIPLCDDPLLAAGTFGSHRGGVAPRVAVLRHHPSSPRMRIVERHRISSVAGWFATRTSTGQGLSDQHEIERNN